jgi:hypothetical protein
VIDPLDLLAAVHGQLAVLGLAALLHPVVSLRAHQRASRGQRAAVLGALLLTGLALATGYWRYDAWRRVERARLVHEDLDFVLLFERKEHLSFVAAALLVAGSALVLPPGDGRHHQAARACLGAALILGLYAAVIGNWAGVIG